MPDLSASTASPPALDWFASAAGARLLACEAQGLLEAGLHSITVCLDLLGIDIPAQM